MDTVFLRNAIILGLLSALGPCAIDMYLPAMPSIALALSASTSAVQLSLMAFFFSLCLGQLFYGPLSDALGRKSPLYFGVGLFFLGSVGCSFSPNIYYLIFFRFIEGFGACAGIVIPRAIVRDLHTGAEATRLMSLLGLVGSVSPLLAPLIGSIIVSIASWRAIFGFVTVVAGVTLVCAAWWLNESHPTDKRWSGRAPTKVTGAYWALLRNRHFLRSTFIGAFGFSCLFSYLANSSFVYIEHYQMKPLQCGILFGINATAYTSLAQLNGRLSAKLGIPRVIRIGTVGSLVPSFVLFVLFAGGFDSWMLMSVLVAVSFGALGLVIPTSSVLALEEHGENAGTASALLGTIQMLTGTIVMFVIARFANGTAMPMLTGIFVCALVSYLLAQGISGQQTDHGASN